MLSGETSFSVQVGGERTALGKVEACRKVCLGNRLGRTGRVEAVRLDQGRGSRKHCGDKRAEKDREWR